MRTERVFLGWDQPLTALVVDHLTRGVDAGVLDLSGTLIVVPTRQAGRRLREALAGRMGESGGAVLSVTTTTPPGVGRGKRTVASNPAVLSVWFEALADAHLDQLPGLFPVAPIFTPAWAAKTGAMLQRLRLSVAEAGLCLADVIEKAGQGFEEEERWQDLATLESAYLERMARYGLLDPVQAQLEDLRNPHLETDLSTIVVAGVTDPAAGLTQILGAMPDRINIEILIHAPDGLAHAFDEWGRPSAEYWLSVHTPVKASNMYLEATPREQAMRVADIVAREDVALADVAIGVPDAGLVPALADVFGAVGVSVFSPAPNPLNAHPVAVLVNALGRFAGNPGFAECADLLRHPDVLAALKRQGLQASAILEQLDSISRDHLPTGLAEVSGFAAAGQCGDLSAAIAWLEDIQSDLSKGPGQTLPGILEQVYRGETLSMQSPDCKVWRTGAEALAEILSQLAETPAAAVAGTDGQWALLAELMSAQTFTSPREDAAVDLEGWLELPWHPAACLIVTGMNEGAVPDGRVDDPFLPDSLRRALGLRTDRVRLARDSHAIQAMTASREGRVFVIAGKRSADGDPLKPSRLLLRCADDELVGRVRMFMGEAAEATPSVQPSAGFHVALPRAAELPSWGAQADLTSVSPSSLRDYLVCPFRFFLKRILRMEEAGEGTGEMDALAFGNLIHAALEAFGLDASVRECDAPEVVERCLHRALDEVFEKHYGRRPPFPAFLQLTAARERLSIAAVEQARLVREGWRIYGPEERFNEYPISPTITLNCRIDRIDRNIHTGEWLVLDYKTSDSGKGPTETHFGAFREDFQAYRKVVVPSGKKSVEKAWKDLQLPLYAAALGANLGNGEGVKSGYFALPRTASGAGVQCFPSTPGIVQSAIDCARGIVEDIRRRRFWPPSAVTYDDFERLFPLGIEAAVNAACFGAGGELL